VLAIACVTATLLAIAWDLGTTLRGIAVTTTPSHPLESFAFAFYEIAGIAGIGPGREDLRRLGAASLAPFAGLIATWGLVLGGLATAGVVRLLRRNTPSAAIVLAGVLLPLGILLALAETAHWRVVGRHLLPLVWWFAYAVAWGVTRRPGSPQPGVSWPLAGAAFVLLTVSSLQIAFAARHEREDYRGASRAALARDHAGDVVWWVASPFGPEYYGRDEPVRRGGSTEADRFLVLLNPAAGGLDSLPAPALVALSRGETFDEHGAVARYVRTNGYRPDGSLRGFELWWCPGAPTP
jgi:hypothetical protein